MNFVGAARIGRVSRIQELLSMGVSTDLKNEALVEAAYYGHDQIVEILLDAGADPNDGKSLQIAAEDGNIQIVEMLLAACAYTNKREALKMAALNEHIQIVEMLLAAGANIGNLSKVHQEKFKHLVPIYISIQEYLMLEPLVINIMELKNRYIVDVVPNKKYIVLK